MDFEIKKENFANPNFNIEAFILNNLKKEAESDIFNFKMKMVQREINNDIDSTFNNLIKSSKNMSDDLTNINIANDKFSSVISNINHKKITQKQVNEIEKLAILNEKAKKLNEILSIKEY